MFMLQVKRPQIHYGWIGVINSDFAIDAVKVDNLSDIYLRHDKFFKQYSDFKWRYNPMTFSVYWADIESVGDKYRESVISYLIAKGEKPKLTKNFAENWDDAHAHYIYRLRLD
jgi:hypothetical protein